MTAWTPLITATQTPTLSVVIPVYNSEETLPLLVQRLYAVLESYPAEYEVILVNDGSRDKSWQILQEIALANSWIRGINLARNFGQHNALLCGIRAAKNEVIVTMDDDLQHPPEEITSLLRKLDDGFDVVYGVPERQRQGIWRGFASWIIKLSLRVAMGIPIASNVSAFRAFRASLKQAFSTYQSPYVILDVLLSWGTSSFAAVKVKHDRRQFGRSNYTVSRLISHAVNMATGFSTVPLRLASLVGILTSFFGVGVLIFVLGRYFLEGDSPAGFVFLASIVIIFSGAQLLALGIIGEYLGRLHFRSMERPPYVIAETVGADAKTEVGTAV